MKVEPTWVKFIWTFLTPFYCLNFFLHLLHFCTCIINFIMKDKHENSDYLWRNVFHFCRTRFDLRDIPRDSDLMKQLGLWNIYYFCTKKGIKKRKKMRYFCGSMRRFWLRIDMHLIIFYHCRLVWWANIYYQKHVLKNVMPLN